MLTETEITALINERLHALAEDNYKQFNSKIIPTGYEMLGVRLPTLRNFSKELAAMPEIEAWLKMAELPTYEHILLYGLVLGQMKTLSLDQVFDYFDPLILRFDNWAHVDTLIAPKLFKKHSSEVLAHYLPLKSDAGEFTKRFFVILLMDMYMTDEHIDSTLEHLTEVPQGQYYVDMGIAWALSLALIKFYDRTVGLFKRPVFTKFVHNKAIQKARESYRIAPETKEYLNGLKIKA